MVQKINWEPYDPAWLVQLMRTQFPHEAGIVSNLASCTRGCRESEYYIHFVDAADANMPGAAWQFVRNVKLVDPLEGEIVLDILTNDQVGGVEFVGRLIRKRPGFCG